MLKQATLPNNETLSYYEIQPVKSEEEQSIVFIHGNFSNYQWWLDVATHPLLDKYHKVLLDLRGFGKSTYNQKCQTFRDWAQDVVEFFKIKGLKRVVLVGWSFGSTITMKVAELCPEVVQKIVLTASVSHLGLPIKDQNDQLILTGQKMSKNPKVAAMLKMLKDNNEEMMSMVFSTILYPKMENYPAQKKKIIEGGAFMQKCYLELMIALNKSDIDITKIKAKTLMIHGDSDIVVPFDLAKETGSALGSFEVWENHGHMIPLQNTDRYVQRILKFIQQ